MKNILKKLAAIRKDIKPMAKAGRNEFHKYNYLSDEQLALALKPLFEKHGVLFTYGAVILGHLVSEGERQRITEISVKYNFYDVESGEVLGGEVPGQGQDSGDKGVYKAITGAIKYIYIKTFNIPTQDDPENEGSPRLPYKRGYARKDPRKDVGVVVDTSKPPFGEGSED